MATDAPGVSDPGGDAGDGAYVKWSPGRMLTWSDFEADANPAEFEDAHSVITYAPEWTVESEHVLKGETSVIRFAIRDLRIITLFRPVLSWSRPPCSDSMLRHQQGHFDLGEIVMRESMDSIRAEICGRWFQTRGKNEDQRKQFAREDSARVIDEEIRQLQSALASRHAKYDADTLHGEDATGQAAYDKVFASLRRSLE